MPLFFQAKTKKEILAEIFKKRQDILILSLLALLIISKLAAYMVFGPGIISADAEARYFPQAEQLSRSFLSFFSQTGPLYSLFLLFSQRMTGSLVTVPVFFQHIVGIISAFLAFHYFKKISLWLAFIVVAISFVSPISVWLEHTVLREAFVSFFIIVMIIYLSSTIKEDKNLKFFSGFLAGMVGLILFFFRVELIILIFLLPLILFLAKKRKITGCNIRDKAFLKWTIGYFLPFFVIFIFYNIFPKKPVVVGTYGSAFTIAYYGLQPDVFYYKNSEYPELLKKYQQDLVENNNDLSRSVGAFYKDTEDYLSEHPEIKISFFGLMDKIYVEMITKNSLVYLKSFAINFKNHLVGDAELKTLISKYKSISGISLIDKSFWIFNASMLFSSWILFLLFLPAIPFFFIKWKTLPDEAIISFLAGAIHIFVLSFFSNPAHRFRYGLDPFIYFAQLYLIIILFRAMISTYKLSRRKQKNV